LCYIYNIGICAKLFVAQLVLQVLGIIKWKFLISYCLICFLIDYTKIVESKIEFLFTSSIYLFSVNKQRTKYKCLSLSLQPLQQLMIIIDYHRNIHMFDCGIFRKSTYSILSSFDAFFMGIIQINVNTIGLIFVNRYLLVIARNCQYNRISNFLVLIHRPRNFHYQKILLNHVSTVYTISGWLMLNIVKKKKTLMVL